MAVLSQLLALPHLELRLVQAGPGDPELSWASTTELLDLGEHLEGGEIVLTTGLALARNDPRWRDFVASLSRARVAAIGFGVGVNHASIPPPLIAAASAYRVALVEVPPPVPFIAVSKAVASLLRSDELRAAQRALQVHERLLDGARGPQSSAEVLASIAQATGRQLALVHADGRRLASTGGFSAVSADGSGGDRHRDGNDDEVIPLDETSGVRLVMRRGEPLGPEERAVVAAGAMVLGQELRAERSAEERERERWARLTEGLLTGELGPVSARLLDPAMEVPARVRAIAVQGAAEEVAQWRRTPRTGTEWLVTAAQDLGRHTAAGRVAPGVSLAWQLCNADEAKTELALAAIAAHGLDAIVGRAVDLAEAPLSRQSAAARLGALSTVAQLYAAPREPVVMRVEHGTPLLEALLTGHTAAAGRAPGPGLLAQAVLGSLSLSSSAVDTELTSLRGTLRTVLEHNGQRGPAAAELGIHRNTLRDRIARIARLTGRGIDDPDDRSELWLALRLEESANQAALTTTVGEARRS